MGILPRKLEKLKVKSYVTPSRTGIFYKEFEVMFNPETYSLTYTNDFSGCQSVNSSGKKATYAYTRPEQLSLKIIIDGTGVRDLGMVKAAKSLLGMGDDVYKDVQKFLKLTTYMEGQIHEPRFLKIEWGDLIFKCRLKSVDINYTLFDKNGQPLRAELNARFISDIEDSERIRKENKSSPDLTHIREIKQGDTLPLMVQEIYEDPHYYVQVARANNLDNFRKLKPGQELFFPPVE